MDICRVWLEPRTVRRHGYRLRIGRQLIVAIPLSQKGAVRLDEQTRALALLHVLEIAAVERARRDLGGYPPSAELVASVPALRRPLEVTLVALPSASDTPPVGSIGYYGDGTEHVAAVILSATGRRLFLEFDVDEVVRTNVLQYLVGDG